MSKYVSISAIDEHTSNYIFGMTDLVKTNGTIKQACEIVVGDTVSFYDASNNIVSFKVASVNYSRYEPTCFTGDCYVYTTNFQEKRVNELNIGDLVLNSDQQFVPITHILKTMVGRELELYTYLGSDHRKRPGGMEKALKITGWHPVMTSGSTTWKFPAQNRMFKPITEWTAAVYSIAVEGRLPIFVNEIAVATLGHNLSGPVIEHEYFGTQRVLDDIERISNAKNGYAVIHMHQIVRNADTGNVERINN